MGDKFDAFRVARRFYPRRWTRRPAAANTQEFSSAIRWTERESDDCGLFLVAYEREHGSLRVLAVDDPASAGHLHRTVQDLPAAGFNAFDGCFDRVDVEVEVPA